MLALMGRFGRLGNQLWTYANVMAYALDKRIPLINMAFEGGMFFNGIRAETSRDCELERLVLDGAVIKKLARFVYKVNLRVGYYPFIQLGEGNLLNLDSSREYEADLVRPGFVFLSGFYFYAPESVERNKRCIKKFFSLVPRLEEKVSALVSAARADGDVLVGVHIRHGDYRTYCDGIMYYSAEEYADAMRCIAEQLPGRKVSFLVCSDEKQDLGSFRGVSVHQSDNEPVVDMYALSCCDYIFGPNSTFSQWASFYGDAPLHVLDWRTAETYGVTTPIREPNLAKDFSVYSANMFGKYSDKQVFLNEFIKTVR